MTLNRFCGSGQQAITVAATGVASGAAGSGGRRRRRIDVALGRHRRRRRRSTAATRRSASCYPTVPQGISADLIATLEGFTRADVDAFAVESQRRAAVAIAEGRFDRSIIAVTDDDGAIVAGPRRAPAGRHHVWRSWPGSAPRSRRLGAASARRGIPHVRRDLPSTVTRASTHRARPPRRQLLGRRRRRGGRRRRLRGLGDGRTGSRRAPASGPPPRSAASRSSCSPRRARPPQRCLDQGRHDALTTSTCGRSTRPSPPCRSRRSATSTSTRSG